MAQSQRKKHCGKCRRSGHSIRTCQMMVKESKDRAAEVAKKLVEAYK